MKTLEMKRCPFCGSLPIIKKWHGGGPRKHAVCCDNDNCSCVPMVTGSTKERAIEKWNTRY